MTTWRRKCADIGHGRVGKLRIGSLAGCIEYPLSPACRIIMQEAPALTLRAAVEPLDVLLPALLNAEFDLLVVPQAAAPHEDIVQEYLFEDQFAVIASPNHKLVRRKRVTMAELAQERWILSTPGTIASQELFRAFEDSGLPPPRVAMRTTSIPRRDMLVAGTDLLGHSSMCMARAAEPCARLAQVHVGELEWVRRICVAYRRDAYLPPAATRFVEILKSIVRNERLR